jgi:excisionase family DNA binding protein
MNETILTAKQAQDLLKVDRTTIYRMLKDGRLNGVKVGNQWRFYASEINNMLSITRQTPTTNMKINKDILPLHCMQPVQDVFAEIAEVGSVTTGNDGVPLTRISNSCDFCKLILGTDEGRQACISSWRKLSEQKENHPEFTKCHAGLSYARGQIDVNSEVIALLVAGQFYISKPDLEEETQRIKELSKKFHIDESLLMQSSKHISILDDRKTDQISGWIEKIVGTFESISSERANMIGRLQQITEMSLINP